MFASLLAVLELQALGKDPRFALPADRQQHAALLNLEVSRCLVAKDTQHWLAQFSKADVLCAEAVDFAGFRAAPQAVHMQTFADVEQFPYGPVPLPRVPGGSRDWPLGSAPRVGEHTLEILAEFGVSQAECTLLVSSGVVRQVA